MRSRWNMPIYVAYVGLCITALGFIVLQMGITLPWSHAYRVSAMFHDAAGVLANNEVFMNGTKIGRIETVSAVGGEAKVDMVVESSSGLPIYRDAQAQVRIKNLLGETYVELSRGSKDAGVMESGSTIPVERTITPVQIDEVLAVLDPQSRDRLKLLINGAGDALSNNGGNLNDQASIVNDLTHQLNGPAAELKARQDQLDDIVLELQRFYTVLAQQRDTVREEFGTWAQVMAQEAAQEQSIKGTIIQADSLLQSIDTLVSGEVPNIRALFDELPPTLRSLSGFLTASNQILNPLVDPKHPEVLKAVDAIFLNLGTSFADTDPTTNADPAKQQHLWSVYGVGCFFNQSGNLQDGCTNQKDSFTPAAPNATWAAVLSGSGR
jgi:phospholipid/cholesterol/gamma-HCH transport system substrate-binding protein